MSKNRAKTTKVLFLTGVFRKNGLSVTISLKLQQFRNVCFSVDHLTVKAFAFSFILSVFMVKFLIIASVLNKGGG